MTIPYVTITLLELLNSVAEKEKLLNSQIEEISMLKVRLETLEKLGITCHYCLSVHYLSLYMFRKRIGNIEN